MQQIQNLTQCELKHKFEQLIQNATTREEVCSWATELRERTISNSSNSGTSSEREKIGAGLKFLLGVSAKVTAEDYFTRPAQIEAMYRFLFGMELN